MNEQVTSEQATLINLTKCLLDSIVQGNWEAYSELCDPSITCFEPEARGNLVAGMDFHQFYFQLSSGGGTRHIQTTLASPHVRLIGENGAVVSYVRLTQVVDASGHPITRAAEETRIWERQKGAWKHVHFHRSPLG